MSIELHILKASGRLNQFEALIRSASDEVVQLIKEKITLPPVDVVVTDNDQAAIPETGVGGYASTAHLLHIHINPEFPGIEGTLVEEIKSTLAHELHHCSRMATVGYGKTLLEALVSEGLADHFDIEINGGKPKPWCVSIAGKELDEWEKKAEKEFDNGNYDHTDWFFGSRSRGIPKWIGYTVGFQLVGEYLKKCDKTAGELVETDALFFRK